MSEWLAYMARRAWCRIVGHKPFYPDLRISGLSARPWCDRCDDDFCPTCRGRGYTDKDK